MPGVKSELKEKPSREEALDYLAVASNLGSLGLFIGAGFPKAFVKGSNRPLSWNQLLEKVATDFSVPVNEAITDANGFPDQASRICDQIAQIKNWTYQEAVAQFKGAIAKITNWLPRTRERDQVGQLLQEIEPSWIITTNYDFVIESMLPDKGVQLAPSDTFVAPKGLIPIFHLHGHRLKPDSIVITQEDYIELNRPNDYRQVRLPIMFKESTVLTMGYGVGDPNVLTAMDWAKNVYANTNSLVPSDLIQVKWSENPKLEPYRDKNRILIIETADLNIFLSEFVERIRLQKEADAKARRIREDLTTALKDPAKDNVIKFIDDANFRHNMISTFSRANLISVSAMVQFLSKCIEETDERSKPYGAFEPYNQKLTILLDMIVRLPLDKLHPILFDYVADSLNSVAYYVGDKSGQSWSACETWNTRYLEIPAETLQELKNYASRHEKIWLPNILSGPLSSSMSA